MTDAIRMVDIPATAYDGLSLNEGGMGMSSDSIMAMLQRRLKDVDEQLHTRMADLANRTAEAEKLQQKIAAMQALQATLGEYETDEGIDLRTLSDEQLDSLRDAGFEVEFTEHELTLTATTPSGVELEGHEIRSSVTIQSFVSKEEIQAKVQELQTTLNRKNSGNEMAMIQIQSLVSQRANEIGLATNTLRTINDGTKQIIQNI